MATSPQPNNEQMASYESNFNLDLKSKFEHFKSLVLQTKTPTEAMVFRLLSDFPNRSTKKLLEKAQDKHEYQNKTDGRIRAHINDWSSAIIRKGSGGQNDEYKYSFPPIESVLIECLKEINELKQKQSIDQKEIEELKKRLESESEESDTSEESDEESDTSEESDEKSDESEEEKVTHLAEPPQVSGKTDENIKYRITMSTQPVELEHFTIHGLFIHRRGVINYILNSDKTQVVGRADELFRYKELSKLDIESLRSEKIPYSSTPPQSIPTLQELESRNRLTNDAMISLKNTVIHLTSTVHDHSNRFDWIAQDNRKWNNRCIFLMFVITCGIAVYFNWETTSSYVTPQLNKLREVVSPFITQATEFISNKLTSTSTHNPNTLLETLP